MAYLLVSHDIKKYTLYTYLVHRKYVLHMKLYFMEHFIVILQTCYIHIQRYLICDQQYHILHTLHHKKNKLNFFFKHLEERNLVENLLNAVEEKSISYSIDESSKDHESDNISISTIILGEFSIEVKYIQNLTQDMLD